jgi:ethanolamine permease
MALTGLVASFHTTIYAYGRVLFALSRAGYIPRWVSRTSRFHTPAAALLVGAAVGLGCTFAIRAFGEGSQVGAGLLNMAVFGAVLSYVLVLVSYIRLRVVRPAMVRPYRSPLGIPGAVVGIGLAGLALVATFGVPGFRPAMLGVTLVTLLGIGYFLVYSRHHLVASAPEEENALIERAERDLVHATSLGISDAAGAGTVPRGRHR